MHGKTSAIYHDGKGVFKGLPSPFTATRYHSLIVKKETLPDCLEISAHTAEGEIMGSAIKNTRLKGCNFIRNRLLQTTGTKCFGTF